MASKQRHGYGRLSRGPAGAGWTVAHRVSWELHYGPIPAGLNVLHKCDVPACVRPDHLFLGDQGANGHDAVAKRRIRTKFSSAQVREMRHRHGRGESLSEIARVIGAHHSTVRRIVARRGRRDVL